ncbi:MAG: hypothetical protein ACK4MF_09485 [Hyphomicrobiaceae bacterium]
MNLKSSVAVLLAACTLAASAHGAAAHKAGAAVTGLAAMHDMRREKGRLCMTDHFHHGSSAGQPSKAAAMKEAVASWSGFTAFEYGNEWANFAKAGSKTATCTKSTSGSWGCELQARPCR